MCKDYQSLNKCTCFDMYVMLLFKEIFDTLGQAMCLICWIFVLGITDCH